MLTYMVMVGALAIGASITSSIFLLWLLSLRFRDRRLWIALPLLMAAMTFVLQLWGDFGAITSMLLVPLLIIVVALSLFAGFFLFRSMRKNRFVLKITIWSVLCYAILIAIGYRLPTGPPERKWFEIVLPHFSFLHEQPRQSFEYIAGYRKITVWDVKNHSLFLYTDKGSWQTLDAAVRDRLPSQTVEVLIDVKPLFFGEFSTTEIHDVRKVPGYLRSPK